MNIVYFKEYIAGTKVMRKVVFADGTTKIEHIRDMEFRDTKTFPELKIEEPVVIEKTVVAEQKEKIQIEEKPKIKNEELKDIFKGLDKRKKKKVIEEEVISLPSEEELQAENGSKKD